LVSRSLSVANLLDLPIIAVEPDRYEIVEVRKHAAAGLVFEDVGNAAEVVGRVPGRLVWCGVDGEVKGDRIGFD
jgi:hypothetical protein